MSETIYLLLLALVIAIVYFVINRTIGNRARVKEIQARMTSLQKEFKDLADAKDEKKMEEKQKEMSTLMMESMRLSFKPLLVSLPILFFLFGFSFFGFSYGGIVHQLFPGFSIVLPIALHLNGHELLGLHILQDATYGSRGFYIICLFVFGLVLELVVGRFVDKKPNADKDKTKH